MFNYTVKCYIIIQYIYIYIYICIILIYMEICWLGRWGRARNLSSFWTVICRCLASAVIFCWWAQEFVTLQFSTGIYSEFESCCKKKTYEICEHGYFWKCHAHMAIFTPRSRTLQFRGCHRPGYASLVDLRISIDQLLSSLCTSSGSWWFLWSLGYTLASIGRATLLGLVCGRLGGWGGVITFWLLLLKMNTLFMLHSRRFM